MTKFAVRLPIDEHIAEIVAAVERHPTVIIEAPPGSGKTTRIAPALLRSHLSKQASTSDSSSPTIALIQPRRIAARAAAHRIAFEDNSAVGEKIGYQVRFDTRATHATRLIAMTPGILLRRLQTDPLLESIDCVVLDEFHERSVETDLLLGILVQLQVSLRPELRVVIMSATLQSDGLATYLKEAPIIKVATNNFPVELRYSKFLPPDPRRSTSSKIIDQTIEAIQRTIENDDGDILVFLPGVGEIQAVARSIEQNVRGDRSLDIIPLYGELDAADQDRALKPSALRKVVLATNIAETSLTIDGIKVVIDSGWARVQRFDPSVGLDRLELEPISQASATQRSGRSGRTASGICYRLWDEVTGRSRPEFLEPEIHRVDLTGPYLLLKCWSEGDTLDFPWLSPPKSSSLEHAHASLEAIGAVRAGRLTDLGRTINDFPAHPRVARLILEGIRYGIVDEVCLAAAILSERDFIERPKRQPGTTTVRNVGHAKHPSDSSSKQSRTWQCDVWQRIEALQDFSRLQRTDTALGTVKAWAATNLLQVAKQFRQLAKSAAGRIELSVSPTVQGDLDSRRMLLSKCLLTAFPDRLAKRRSPTAENGLMVGGRGVRIDEASGVKRSLYFLCLDVDGRATDASVRIASGIEPDWMEQLKQDQSHCGPTIESITERFFHPSQGAVVSRRRQYWLDLLISETPCETVADEATADILSLEAARKFWSLLPAKDPELHSLLGRIQWLVQAMPDAALPKFSEAELSNWISRWCYGMKSLDEVRRLPWRSLIKQMLNVQQIHLLEREAPESIQLPSSRIVLLKYEAGKPPILAARIQEFFGWKSTPKLAGGRVPLLLHLLAPNNRVFQITDDLSSFWSSGYALARKELRGRYPKHNWPEDPLAKQ